MITLSQPHATSTQTYPQSQTQRFTERQLRQPNILDAKSESQRFVERLKAHEVEAFETLVERYTPRLLSVAKRILRNAEDAADVVQDTYLLAYLSIHKFRGLSSIYTWLHRILVNASLMKLRSQAGDRSVSFERLARDSGVHSCRSAVDFPAESSNCQMESAEMKAFVRDCIDDLPAEYRTIILLRDIERLDTAQTAEMLKISRGAVKTRLHRARQALRALIEDAFVGIIDPRLSDRNLPAFIASNEI